MKVTSLCLFLFFSCCGAGHLYSQTKKAPVKKTVANRSKPPVKKNTAVTKPSVPVKNKVSTASKSTPVAKLVHTTLPSKGTTQQVNSSEIKNVTLTSRELEMINEINNLRLKPEKYITYVQGYLQKYNATEEAKTAAGELIAILKNLKPLQPLTLDPAMYNDAKQHGLSMAQRNVFDHSSLPYYENLSLGHRDIRDAIVDLLIDEGIPNRGHRNNLLSDKIKYVAVFEVPGKVKNIGYCYVQVFR